MERIAALPGASPCCPRQPEPAMPIASHSSESILVRLARKSGLLSPARVAASGESGLPGRTHQHLPYGEIRNELMRLFQIDRHRAQAGLAYTLPIIVRGMQNTLRAEPEAVATQKFMDMLVRICGSGVMRGEPLDAMTAVRRGRMLLTLVLGPSVICTTASANAAHRSGLDQQLLQDMMRAVAVLIARQVARELHWKKRRRVRPTYRARKVRQSTAVLWDAPRSTTLNRLFNSLLAMAGTAQRDGPPHNGYAI